MSRLVHGTNRFQEVESSKIFRERERDNNASCKTTTTCFEELHRQDIAVATMKGDLAVQSFQVELSDALEEKEALERLPDAALNRLDSLRWEKQRGDGMIECRRQANACTYLE